MSLTPHNFPRLSSAIVYQDAARAIDWLCDAFGFQLRLKVEGDSGQVIHSELTCGDGVIIEEPSMHDYGEDYWSDRSYGAIDPDGHVWWITQRVRNPGKK